MTRTTQRPGLRDVTNAVNVAQNKNKATTNNGPQKAEEPAKPEQQAASSVQAPAAAQQQQSTNPGPQSNNPAVNNPRPKARAFSARQRNSQSQAVVPVVAPVLPQQAEISLIGRDPQEAAEYAQPIYRYLKEAEKNKNLKATPDYLEHQLEISARMRGILLDWLVEVHYKFKLVPETLYLCINLIDRYLDKDRNVVRKKLQLVGGTCMLIASKYEEFRPPEVGDICYIMDNAYTRDDILDMEVKIMNTLKFEVTVPSALQFLEYYIKTVGISREDDHFFLSQYLIEVTLLEPQFLKYNPSRIAASALYLANRIRKSAFPWPAPLQELTGLAEATEVKPLAKAIFEVVPHYKTKSLYKKYSMEKYHAVAPTIPNQ